MDKSSETWRHHLNLKAIFCPACIFINLHQRPTVSSGVSPAAWFPPQSQTSPNQGLASYHLSQAAPLKTTFLGFSSLMFAKMNMFGTPTRSLNG